MFSRKRKRSYGRLGYSANRYQFEGCCTGEDYDVSFIKKARINYRPGLALAGVFTGLTNKKVVKKPVKTNESEKEDNGEELTD